MEEKVDWNIAPWLFLILILVFWGWGGNIEIPLPEPEMWERKDLQEFFEGDD